MQVAVGALEADLPEVLQRRGVAVAAEGVLQRSGAHAGYGGHVGGSDVAVGVVVGVGDGSAQSHQR